MDRSPGRAAAAASSGADWVLTHEHQLRTYESDGLLQYEVTPAVAVLPGTGRRGARGGRRLRRGRACRGWPAAPARACPAARCRSRDGVLIVLSRLTRILEVDLDNGRVCVEPGVTNAAVSAAVGPHLFYPPDPSSQIVCTIGGNVAENSGGAHCFKYGFTTNYVLGLEVVLADGAVVTLRRRRARTRPATTWSARSSAPRARWASRPRSGCGWCRGRRRCGPWSRSSTPPATPGGPCREIVAAGVVPGAIEMMDAATIAAVEQMAHAGYPVGRGAALLVELDGPETECAALFDEVAAICAELRLRRRADRRRRGAAGAVLEDPQVRLPGDGPALAQLLRAGRRDPADPAARGAGPHRRARVRVRADGGERVPRRRRQPAPAGLLRRPGRRARRRGPRSCPGASSTSAWTRAARSPASTASAWTSASTCRRCSARPTWTRSSGCGARSTRPGWPTRARSCRRPRLCGEVPGPYRQHPLEAAGLAERF